MTKKYLLSVAPAPSVPAAVFATGVVNPFELLEDIEKELAAAGIQGCVLFDLLLANGHKTNRYFVAQFDGKEFGEDGFKAVAVNYDDFARVSAQILQEHSATLDLALLSPAMRFAVERGIPF